MQLAYSVDAKHLDSLAAAVSKLCCRPRRLTPSCCPRRSYRLQAACCHLQLLRPCRRPGRPTHSCPPCRSCEVGCLRSRGATRRRCASSCSETCKSRQATGGIWPGCECMLQHKFVVFAGARSGAANGGYTQQLPRLSAMLVRHLCGSEVFC